MTTTERPLAATVIRALSQMSAANAIGVTFEAATEGRDMRALVPTPEDRHALGRGAPVSIKQSTLRDMKRDGLLDYLPERLVALLRLPRGIYFVLTATGRAEVGLPPLPRNLDAYDAVKSFAQGVTATVVDAERMAAVHGSTKLALERAITALDLPRSRNESTSVSHRAWLTTQAGPDSPAARRGIADLGATLAAARRKHILALVDASQLADGLVSLGPWQWPELWTGDDAWLSARVARSV